MVGAKTAEKNDVFYVVCELDSGLKDRLLNSLPPEHLDEIKEALGVTVFLIKRQPTTSMMTSGALPVLQDLESAKAHLQLKGVKSHVLFELKFVGQKMKKGASAHFIDATQINAEHITAVYYSLDDDNNLKIVSKKDNLNTKAHFGVFH